MLPIKFRIHEFEMCLPFANWLDIGQHLVRIECDSLVNGTDAMGLIELTSEDDDLMAALLVNAIEYLYAN